MEELKSLIIDVKNTAEAIPYNYRIRYKVPQICMILEKSTLRGGVSLIKIHIISNALNNNNEKQKLLEFIENKTKINIKVDPRVNLALSYGYYDKLIEIQKNGKFILTNKGKKLVEKIYTDDNIFSREKEILNKIGTDILEEDIEELNKSWRLINAYNQ